MRNRIILLLIGFMCYAGMGNAQEDKTEKAVPAIVSDSVEVAAPDSTVQAVLMANLRNNINNYAFLGVFLSI